MCILRGLSGLQAGVCVAYCCDQCACALVECGAERFQGTFHIGGKAAIGLLLVVERGVPCLCDAGSGHAKAIGQAVELLLHGRGGAFMHGPGLLRDAMHRCFKYRPDALASRLRAIGQALTQRLVDRTRQRRVSLACTAMKLFLIGEQALVQLPAQRFDLQHHCLQLVDHLRQSLRLQLQRPEGLLALTGVRKAAQDGSGLGIEQLACLHPLATAQCRHQAQHRRGRDAGDRGAESEAQALHRHCQRRAHCLKVGSFFQGKDCALERDDHSQEGAKHPQHDQQADQVGRQGRAGQAGTFALDTQAYGVLQRIIHAS